MPNNARSRAKKKSLPVKSPVQVSAPPESDEAASPYPSLRSALWLYLIVLLGTFSILVVFPPDVVDPIFLRLITALVVAGGFSFAALFITDVRPGVLFGKRPPIPPLVAGFVAGVAIWMPVLWIFSILNGLLNTYVGTLTPPIDSGATPLAIAIQSGLIIPVCQGLLFWAYIQRAAEGVGMVKGAIITAVLFGVYGLFSTEFALSGIPAMFLAGLVAAFAVYFTGSAWTGVAVTAGFGIARLVLESTLLNFVTIHLSDGSIDPNSLFGVRWIAILALSLFISFIMIRIMAASQPTDQQAPVQRARIRRFWGIPVVLVALLLSLIGFGEILTRLRHPLAVVNAPPLRAIPTATITSPEVPPVQATTPLQTPQPTNK